jgi:large subunit ribosomal protein L9
MRVLFTQDVPGVGAQGEVKEVSPGYGKNFLLPRGLAVLAIPSALKAAEEQKEAQQRERSQKFSELEEIGGRIRQLPILTIKAKAGEEGKLFGSITASHIARSLSSATGVEVDRRWIKLPSPIRKLGNHEARVRLRSDLVIPIQISVKEDGGETSPL